MNKVYIAASIDGYIADKNDGLDWLQMVPNPDNLDLGFSEFMDSVDGLIMGRKTFETVCSFDIEWPYPKPVFVLSNSLKSIPEKYQKYAELINGNLQDIIKSLENRGIKDLYIDGGTTIQSFLKEDMIDELIVSTMPILLGGGSPLFAELPDEQKYELESSKVLLGQIVQSHYRRIQD
jgi:dihydrofolate reductase